MKNKTLLLALAASFMLASCAKESKYGQLLVKKEAFEEEHNGKPVHLYTLENENGLVVQLTNYGATVVSVLMPDKYGVYNDVVLGYRDLDGYINDKMYLGCAIGRFANRIDKGSFKIDGKTYQLEQNEGENSLHSGSTGFHKQVWDAEQNGNTVTMKYISRDGEGGFPGNLTTTIIFTLTEKDELVLDYLATTDKATVINLTNHSYFNMAGEGKATIYKQKLMINADRYTPVNDKLIPVGENVAVENTPFDFREPVEIGTQLAKVEDEQIKIGSGVDHNFALAKEYGKLGLALKYQDPESGRSLELSTTEPGVQIYTGNFMDGTVMGKNGLPYNHRGALVIEPQHFPDSPNQEKFPSTILKPGEKYIQKSIYKFRIGN